ncbi:MAG: ECF transporter S component [Clostridiaceae bacterium]|mgnify:FL=1|jgi:riboflavin transporter FmnP|nr:ECF transporter S component [Bacillota bacterium]NLI39532.1 ECF transporter S component [Clostridiaceae bacterium]
MQKSKAKFIAKVGVLSALASAIMFIETPLPFMPPFLKLDLSEIIVLLGAFALGPLAGVAIELVKNLVHLPFSITGGVGEFANFVVGCALVVPAALVYKRNKTMKTAIKGLVIGSLSMVVLASLINYFVMIPLYVEIFAKQFNITAEQSMQSIVQMSAEENQGIMDFKTLILFGIVPFNIVKVIIVSLLTFVSYKRVSPLLHR